MSSMTAQIVAGSPDMYHGGIRPIHTLWLSENGRPGWILEETWRALHGPPSGEHKDEAPPPWAGCWIPSAPEHILEDGILLIAVHALRDEEVRELAESRLPDLLEGDWVDLTKMPGERLAELRERCLQIELGYKLVVTVLGGSSLEEQLPVLERYPMQVEVCTVTYSRVWGGFGGPSEAQAEGSLRASWSSAGPTPHRYREVNLTSTLPGALAECGVSPSGSLRNLEVLDVFAHWTEVMNELKHRKLIRSTNSTPLGGYAETLVARRFNTKPLMGRDKGYDFVRPDTQSRVQVKARRDPAGRAATHFDFGLFADKRFDEFVGVVFNEDFSVRAAWNMPWETVDRLAGEAGGKRRLRIRDVENAVAAGEKSITELDLDQIDVTA